MVLEMQKLTIKEDFSSSLETSLWRALAEGMVLLLLRERDASAPTLTNYMRRQCPSTSFNPYKTIVLLEDNGCVKNIGARVDTDGRRRQFYRITKEGRQTLERFLKDLQHIVGEVYLLADLPMPGAAAAESAENAE